MVVQKKPVVIEDPRAIRALAHPARLEAIDRLYGGDVTTATELGDATGLSASAMSYHLREPAKWGVIERVSDSQDEPEPWNHGLSVGTHELLITAEELASLNDEVGELLQRYDRRRADRPADARHLRFAVAAIPIRKPSAASS